MSAANDSHGTPYYFVPQPSRHPAMGALALFLIAFGASQWINDLSWGRYAVLAGFLVLFGVLFQWFGEGKLKPLVSQTYPLEKAADAINHLGQRRAVGKVVVKVR